ncbi:aminotransferase class I/II-fold pyridoxal phosphate-dependent enzyme [Oceanirhabdus seepicola]|uniref:Aminotransferase class I/II-fold pyridoxal phosphate-dependent enzyme n=1 Tax=Oceanirhabdus seepicola TaxID=2828781 RepID=A0A9J6P6Z4_9CLOT|nr:aminotransferase class I/II-fold pyridoxal phosphate-dependent enzyme [Oceanirhabdus seepicola]
MVPLCIPEISGNEVDYVKECIESGWVSSTGGEYLNKFEEEFSRFTGIKYSNAVINGTAALHLALAALNVGEGDEVIVPSLTFISTVNVIKYVGAKVIFVDVNLENYTIDTKEIEKAVSERTKAIIPVHLYGNLADMDKIMEIAHKNNLYVIEDATEALGSKKRRGMAGGFGHIGCYSFNGNKLMTTGAGGMICTNDEKINERIDYLKNQTKTVLENGSIVHNEIGFNYRMPNILAAFGLAQLEQLDKFILRKKEITTLYKKELSGILGLGFPKSKCDEDICQWLNCIEISEEYGVNRDELIKHMNNEKVICRPFFYPLHKMEAFSGEKVMSGELINTELCSARGINLPSSVGITDEEIVRVCSILKNSVKNSQH